MANWTNKHGIDEAIAVAIRTDTYRMVGDISVTGLLRPPQMAALERAHENEIEQDVSDGIWRLLGRAMHHVLSEAHVEGSLREHRLSVVREGWTVSGAFDRWYETGDLIDYKCTSVWSYIYGGRSEWQAQLNFYAMLAEEHGLQVNDLKIVGIFRDWNKRNVKENDNYPTHPFGEFKIEKWPREYTERLMRERIQLHQNARESFTAPPCTNDDRWARPDTWAVQKPGAKRAYRVFNSQFKASEFAQGRSEYQVVHRKGTNIRCESYCPVVQWCDQAKQLGVVPDGS